MINLLKINMKKILKTNKKRKKEKKNIYKNIDMCEKLLNLKI